MYKILLILMIIFITQIEAGLIGRYYMGLKDHILKDQQDSDVSVITKIIKITQSDLMFATQGNQQLTEIFSKYTMKKKHPLYDIWSYHNNLLSRQLTKRVQIGNKNSIYDDDHPIQAELVKYQYEGEMTKANKKLKAVKDFFLKKNNKYENMNITFMSKLFLIEIDNTFQNAKIREDIYMLTMKTDKDNKIKTEKLGSRFLSVKSITYKYFDYNPNDKEVQHPTKITSRETKEYHKLELEKVIKFEKEKNKKQDLHFKNKTIIDKLKTFINPIKKYRNNKVSTTILKAEKDNIKTSLKKVGKRRGNKISPVIHEISWIESEHKLKLKLMNLSQAVSNISTQLE